MSLENEAKRLAAVHARWFRDPVEALFGKSREGPVMVLYKRLKNAKNKDDIKNTLSDLAGLQISQYTQNDLNRLIAEIFKRIDNMNDEDAVKFSLEVFRYLQISLFTRIDNTNKGIF